MTATIHPNVSVTPEQIAAFCEKWKITKFELFGSVLRDDFDDESDIDVLATFQPDAPWSLFDLADARQELMDLFGRSVDLVERVVIEQSENPARRRSILTSARSVYAV